MRAMLTDILIPNVMSVRGALMPNTMTNAHYHITIWVGGIRFDGMLWKAQDAIQWAQDHGITLIKWNI